MSSGQSQSGLEAPPVSADVSMDNVAVDGDYTTPVTFTVTSLSAENVLCFNSSASKWKVVVMLDVLSLLPDFRGYFLMHDQEA